MTTENSTTEAPAATLPESQHLGPPNNLTFMGNRIFPIPLDEFTLDGLDPALHEYVDWEGYLGPVFDHPLYRDVHMIMTAALPEQEGWPDKSVIIPAGLARINLIVAYKQKLADEFRAAKKWAAFVFTYHRPYRVDALLEAVNECGASKLWPLVGDVWCDSESNMRSAYDWNEIWARAYDSKGNFRKCFSKVMGAADRRVYDALPTMITAYRGCYDENDTMAYSWTLDKAKAEWFARRKRFNGSPVVAKIEVHKSFALAYFGGREGSEIVLDYEQGLDCNEIEISEMEPKLQEAA